MLVTDDQHLKLSLNTLCPQHGVGNTLHQHHWDWKFSIHLASVMLLTLLCWWLYDDVKFWMFVKESFVGGFFIMLMTFSTQRISHQHLELTSKISKFSSTKTVTNINDHKKYRCSHVDHKEISLTSKMFYFMVTPYLLTYQQKWNIFHWLHMVS